MEGRFDEKHVELKINSRHVITNGQHAIKIAFGDLTNEQIDILVMNILTNISAIKDPLKKKLKSKGIDPKIVEDSIKASPHLQWVIDIVNLYKHGEPLERPPRSGCYPRIVDCQQVLSIDSRGEAGSSTSFTMDADGTWQVSGNPLIKVIGIVKDEHGNFLCMLDDLVEKSFIEFDKIVSYHLY
jgi:hypothetical protein